MVKGLQKTLLELGKYGCYFLSVVKAAERDRGRDCPILPAFFDMKKRGFIGNDCYMLHPDRVLSTLTGKPYTVRRESKDYKAEAGEIEILRFEWRGEGGVSAHFVLGDGNGRVAYDPLDGANTVKNGTVESKRIFTPAKR